MAGLHGIRRYGAKRALEIYENLGKKNLWQRMVKNTTATTMAGKSKAKIHDHRLTHFYSQRMSHSCSSERHRQSSISYSYDHCVWPSRQAIRPAY